MLCHLVLLGHVTTVMLVLLLCDEPHACHLSLASLRYSAQGCVLLPEANV